MADHRIDGGIIVRTASPADAPALALVAGATFLETFADIIAGQDIVAHVAANNSAEKFGDWIDDAESRVWIAERKATAAPIGYALLTAPDLPDIVTGADDVELKRIYILSRYHGGGLAGRMMEAVVVEARGMGKTRLLLGVYAANDRAIAFYRKQGFEIVGDRRFQVGAALFEDKIMARKL